jgi:hypothetical protein
MTRIHKDLAFEVLSVFSLFEYGLKKIGYRTAGRKNIAEVDWETWYKENENAVIQPHGENFSSHLQYLTSRPAKKQVLDDQDEIVWKTINVRQDEKDKVAKLAQLVKAVRNNFFHGGKYFREEIEEPIRDERLLRSSSTILRAIIEMNPKLKSAVQEAEASYYEIT